MATLSWDWDWETGTRQPLVYAARLTELSNSIKRGGFRQPLVAASREISKDIDMKFQTGGPGWAPLSESTKRQKTRNKERILVHTGKLQKSAAAFARWHVADDKAEYMLPADISYGFYHVTGTSRMPQRDWLDLDNELEKLNQEYFDPWLAAKIAKVMK